MAWASGSVVIRRFLNADFLHITFMQEALTLLQWAGVLPVLGTGVFVGLAEKAAES